MPALPRSLDEARALEAAGARMKFLYFWGHQPSRDGSPGPGCLSQWWDSPFTIGDVTYATAEHWMMAQKARLFGDEQAFARIVEAAHPGQAKRLGREVRGFDEQTWLRHRFDIVVQGSLAKFDQNPSLRRFLVDTGERVLVEASPLDAVWGIGLAADDERAASPARWQGLNLLGFALMQARTAL